MTTTDTAAQSGSWLQALSDWAVSLMDVLGPVGAGAAIALENLFPPIPSEAILPLAGLAAQRGSFSLAEALIWTTVGSLVGAMALYLIGALVGVDRLRRLFNRLPLLEGADIDRTVEWFHRHGGKAVFFGRFVPVFRSLISIPAGIVRMPIWRFLLYTFAGSAIWNTVFVLIGWYLGESWHIVEQYMDIAQKVVIAIVVVLIIVFIWRRIVTIRRRRAAASVD